MARLSVFCGFILLTSCARPSEAERAEKRYAIVEQNGSTSEKCEAARAAQQAWLSELNQPKFNDWKLRADNLCLRASIDRRLGLPD